MKKLLLATAVLAACIGCFSSCKLMDKVSPCKHNDIVTDAAVAPTCTESGLTEGSHCTKCGEVVVPQTTVAALGHKEVINSAVTPTCSTTGLTEGKSCSVCNTVILVQAVVPKAHDFSDWTILTDPDCFFEGEKTRSCSICRVKENINIDTLEHSFVQDEETKLFYCEHCDARIYAGHLYAAIDKTLTWYDAYTFCDDLGGHLATITNEREQAIITDMMATATEPLYWIGGIKTNSSQWTWITGEDFIYTQWYTRMPDNAGGIEWFLNVYSETADETTGYWNDLDANRTKHSEYNNSGLICEWNLNIAENEHFFTEWETATDATCFADGEQYRICTHCGLEEKETVPQLKHHFTFNEAKGLTSCEYCNATMYDGHIYKIFTVSLSWFEAYTYCNNLGGHLVTITSDGEQTFVETYMTSQSFTVKDAAWIGAYTDGVKWQWITDEEFDYTNWLPGEPNCSTRTEFFAHINQGSFGQWNDLPPFDTIYFICEWEVTE